MEKVEELDNFRYNERKGRDANMSENKRISKLEKENRRLKKENRELKKKQRYNYDEVRHDAMREGYLAAAVWQRREEVAGERV